ncbi:hypothetical protein M3J09_009292 [Ascochyta lentis]
MVIGANWPRSNHRSHNIVEWSLSSKKAQIGNRTCVAKQSIVTLSSGSAAISNSSSALPCENSCSMCFPAHISFFRASRKIASDHVGPYQNSNHFHLGTTMTDDPPAEQSRS